MNRRRFIQTASATAAWGLAPPVILPAAAQEAPPEEATAPAFSRAWLIGEARRLAAEDYQEPNAELPGDLAEIGYDQYRDIRFRPEARIWGAEELPFTLDLFHPGFIYRTPVGIALVENGIARDLAFSPDYYSYGPGVERPASGENLFFSGFRVRTRINTPDFWDEFLVFQGASYFRAIARDQLYGLSARGVAIDTAEPKGEEFPTFTKFWIEKPDPHAAALVIHALLDSPSLTGAFQFNVIPGAETVIGVEATIFARQEIAKLGIAPLTSMFVFDASNRAGHDDFRPAVHDSDGLQMLTGNGEWLWRPLANPTELRISAFRDTSPRGFGLMQRKRDYSDFEDLQAGYERRPSLWIEPLGDWGTGFTELVEIPTPNEYNDNIVAYWKPDGAVPVGGPYGFAYRMRWTDTVDPESRVLTTRQTRVGMTGDGRRRLFVIDFAGPDAITSGLLTVEASASDGIMSDPIIHDGAPGGMVRVSFELDTDDADVSELRLRLLSGGTAASETWLYRWTPQ